MYNIDDVSTTVMQPHADAETVTVYTLEGKGQTMKKADVQSLPSGIYIVDGKKVVVKYPCPSRHYKRKRRSLSNA